MNYVNRVLGSLVFGAVGTAVLVIIGIAASWVLELTWYLPFLLRIEGHSEFVLVEPHLVGLMAIATVLAVLAAAVRSPAQKRATDGSGEPRT